MPRILLLIQQRGNRQLLARWLSRNYEVAIGEREPDLDQPFDLAIIDPPMLSRLRSRVQHRRAAELPVYLPFLLITSRQDTGALPNEVWTQIDELILAPIDPVELWARAEVLLRIRKDSLDLKRHNGELEVFIAELTRAFEVAEDVTQLTEILLSHALRISDCDSGGIVLLEDGQARLVGIRGEGLQPFLEEANLEALVQQARVTSPQTLPSSPEDPTGPDQAIMPIWVKDEVVGTLVLDKGMSDLDDSERRLLESLCAQGGVFLHNLRQAHRLVEAAQLYHQFELAQTVQQQLLPPSTSSTEGLETAAFYQATNSVGGDYYDIIEVGPRRVAAVIADVAGHSISSGLVMTAARSAFRVLLQREDRPAEVIEQLNQALLPDLEQTGIFITLCLVVADLETMTATYANAGHNAPLVFHQSQQNPVPLEATGVPLGILSDPGYTEGTVPLCVGDAIVMYTDGITEARNAAGNLWGEEGLVECVRKGADGDARSISHALIEGALRHSNRRLDDDLTVLVLKLKEGPSG